MNRRPVRSVETDEMSCLFRRRLLVRLAFAALVVTAIVTTTIWLREPDTATRPDAIWTSSPSERRWDGLRVTMRAPSEVRAGDLFTVRVHVVDNEGAQDRFTMDFGDRELPQFGTDLVCSGVAGQERMPEGPTNRRIVERHAYRAGGTYTIRAAAGTGGCSARIENAIAIGKIRVIPADVPSNGPQPAIATIGHEDFVNDRSVLVTDIVGRDRDGFVNRIELDWGDGSDRLVKTQSLRRCNASAERWPDETLHDDPRHRYANEGTYVLRLRVTSVGCDGRSEQIDRASFKVRYPPEQGSVSPSPKPRGGA